VSTPPVETDANQSAHIDGLLVDTQDVRASGLRYRPVTIPFPSAEVVPICHGLLLSHTRSVCVCTQAPSDVARLIRNSGRKHSRFAVSSHCAMATTLPLVACVATRALD
jgi:hypothetical protein